MVNAEARDGVKIFRDTVFMAKNKHITSDKWVSIRDLYPDGAHQPLLPQTFSRDQFGQGNHYECFMLSALSTLIRFPDVIRHCFVTKKVRQDGRYTFQFFRGKEWVKVEIDDSIAMENGETLYVRSPTQHWWPLLLEKAYAKFYTGYDHLEGCTLEETFHDLTGNPVLNVPMEVKLAKTAGFFMDNVQAWLTLGEYLRNGDYVASTLTKDIYLESMGIQSEQQYAILDVFPLDTSVARTPTLDDLVVHLYNPFEDDEYAYSGPLSREDEAWSPELRAKHPEVDDRHAIFMPYPDFIRIVNSIQLCFMTIVANDATYFVDEWKGITAGGNPTYVTWRNNPLYLMKNNSGMDLKLVVVLKQEDQRRFTEQDESTKYVQCGVVLSRATYPNPKPTFLVTGNNHKSIYKSLFLNSREVANTITIPPCSTCYLVPSTMNTGTEAKYTLALYRLRQQDYSRFSISKLMIPSINFDHPAKQSVKIHRGGHERVDFVVDEPTDVHILMHQTKPYISPYGGDAMTEDYVGMYLYNDEDKKIGGVHAATNYRETSVIHHLPQGGRYALSLTCPRTKEDEVVPLILSIAATPSANARFVETPAGAATFTDDADNRVDAFDDNQYPFLDPVPEGVPLSKLPLEEDASFQQNMSARSAMLEEKDPDLSAVRQLEENMNDRSHELARSLISNERPSYLSGRDLDKLNPLLDANEHYMDVERARYALKEDPQNATLVQLHERLLGEMADAVAAGEDPKVPLARYMSSNSLDTTQDGGESVAVEKEEDAETRAAREAAEAKERAELRPGYLESAYEGRELSTIPLEEDQQFRHVEDDYLAQTVKNTENTNTAEAHRLRGSMDEMATDLAKAMNVNDRTAFLPETVEGKSARELPLSADEEFCELERKRAEILSKDPGMANSEEVKELEEKMRARAAIIAAEEQAHKDDDDVGTADDVDAESSHGRKKKSPNASATKSTESALASKNVSPRLDRVQRSVVSKEEMERIIAQMDQRPMGIAIRFLPLEQDPIFNDLCEAYVDVPTTGRPTADEIKARRDVLIQRMNDRAGELATTVHDTERATLEQRPEGIPLKALPLDEDEKFVGLEREARDIRGKPKLVPADTIHLETIQSDLNERARELAHRVRKEYVDAEPEGIPIEQLRLGNEPDFLTTEAERRMLINEGGDNAEAVGEINRKLNVMAREVAKARMQGDRGYLDRNPEGLPLRVVPLDEDAKFGAMERERARLIAGRHSGAPGNKQKIKDIEQQLNERAHELALEQKERDLDGVGQSPRGIPIASLHPHDDPQFAALLAEVRQLKKDTEANRDEINRLKASMNQRCTDMANDMVVGDRAYLAPRPLGVPIALLPIDKDAEFREMEARRAALKAEDARYHAAAILELEDRLNQRATELAKERMAQELSGLDQCPERVPLDIVKPYNDKIFLSSVDELRELDSTNINDERVRPIKLKMNERCHGLAWSMIEDSRDFLIKDPKGVPIEELPIDNDTAFRELEAQRVVLQHTRGSANKIRGIEDQLNVRVLELADDRLRRDLEGVHPQPEGVSLETIMPHSDPDFAALVEKRRAVERSMGHEESAEERAEKRAELTSIVEALNERARELARGILARDRSYLDRNPEGVPISILPIDTDERFKKLETERTTLKVKDARRNASRIKELEALLNERAHQLALEQKKADLEGLNPEPLGVSLELLRPHSDAQFGQLVNEIRRLRAEDPRDEEAITTCINAMDERAKAMMMKVMARNFLDQEPDGIPLCQLPLDRDEEFRKTEIQRAVMRLTDSRRNASKICELEDKMNQRAHQLAMLQRDVDIECVDEAPCGVPKGLLNLHRDGECGGKLIPELRILKKNPEANVEKIRELEKELDARAHVLARNIVDGDRETYLDPCPLGIPLSDLPLDSDVKFKRMEVSRATLRAQSAKTNTAAIKALEIELNDRAHDLARTVMDDDLKPFDAEYEGVAVKSMKPHQDKVFAENAAQRRRLLREGGPDSEAMVEDCTTTMRSRLIELAKERKNGEFYFLDRDPEGVPLEDIPMSTDETFNELRARREHLKEEDAFAHRDAIVGLEKQMNDRVRQLAKGVLASDFTGVDTHPLGIHIDLLRPRLDPEIVRLIPELRRARRTNYLKNRVPTIEGQMDDRLHVLATNALIEGREDYLPARPEGVPLEILALDADQMFHDGEVRRAILRLSDRTANSTAIREIEKELVARSRELAKDQLHEDLRGIDKEPHGIPLEMLHPHSDPTLSVMISEIRVLKKDPIRFANKIKNQQDAMNERAHDIALDLLEQHREFLDPAPLGVPLADLPLLRDEDFHTDEVSRVNAILHGDRAEEIPELEKRLRRRSEELARKQLNDDLAGLVPAPLGVPLTLLEPHKDERFAEFIPVLRRLIKDPSVNAAKLKSLRVKMDERNLELAEDFLMRDREVYLDPEPEGMRWELLPLNSSAEFKEAEGKKLFLQSKNVEAGREPSDGNSEKISSLERKLNTIAHSIAVQQLRRDRCYLDTNPEGVPLDILPLDTDPTFRTLEASRAAAKARHANAQAGELEDQLNARAHELALEQKAEDLRGLEPFPRGMALADLQPHDDPTFAGLVDEIRLLKASTKNKEKSIRAVQKRMDGVASDMADSLLKRDRGYLHLKPEFVPLRRLPLDANDDFHALEVKRATLKLENTNKNASRIVELEAELNELARELARAVKAKDLQGLTPKPRGIPIELLDPHKSDKFSGMVEEKANLSPEAQAEPNNSTMRALNLFVEQLADSTLKGDRGYLDREPEGVAFTLLPLDSDAAFHELEVERAVLRMTDMQKNLGAIHELQDQLNRRAHELARILLGKDRGYLNPAPEGVPLEVLPLDTDTKFHQMEVDRAKLKSRETSTNSARVRELENRLNARAVELAKKQLEEDVAGLDREPQGYPMIYLFPHSDAEFAANIPPLRAAKAKEDMQHVRDLQSILNSRAHEVAKMRIAQDRSFLNRAPEGVPLELLPLDTDGVFRGAEKDLRGWKAATKKNDAAIQDAQKRMIRRANELARAYLKLSREFLDQEPEGVPLADVALDEDATFRSKEKERLQLLVEPSETTREKVVALEQKLNERAHELARERKASNRWFLNAKSFGVPKELLLLDEDADFIDYEKELLQIMKQEEERVMEGHLQETISINGPAMNVLRDKMQERADIVGKEQVTGDRDHYIEAQIGGVDRSDIPLDEDEEYMNLEVSRAIKMAEAYGKRTEEVKGMERQLAARAYALARALVNADRSFLPREICGIPIDELPLDTDEKFGRLERQLRAHKRAGQRDEMQADEDELKRRAHELAKDVIAQDLAPLRDTYRGIPKEDLNLHSDTKFRELSRLRRKNRGRAVTLIEDEMDQRANKIANELIAREREFLDQEPEGMYLADVPLDSDATFCQLEAEYRRRRRDPLALKKNVKVLTELAAEMNQRSHTLARMEFAKTRDFMDPEPEGVQLVDLALDEDPKFKDAEIARYRNSKRRNCDADLNRDMEQKMNDRAHELALAMLAADREFLDPQPEGVPIEVLELNQDHEFRELARERRTSKKSLKKGMGEEQVKLLEEKMNYRAHEIARQFLITERAFMDQEPEGVPLDDLPLNSDAPFRAMENQRLKVQREGGAHSQRKLTSLEADLNSMAHKIARELLKKERGFLDAEPMGVPLEELPLNHDTILNPIERRRRQMRKEMKRYHDEIRSCEDQMADRVNEIANNFIEMERAFMDQEPEGVPLRYLPLLTDKEFHEMELQRRKSMHRPASSRDGIERLERKMNDRAHALAKDLVQKGRSFLDPEPLGVPIADVPLNGDEQFRKLEEQRRSLKQDPRNATAVKVLEERLNDRAYELAQDLLNVERAFMNQSPEGIALEDLPLNDDRKMQEIERKRRAMRKENPEQNAIEISVLEDAMENRAHELATKQLADDRDYLDPEPCGVPLCDIPLDGDHSFHTMELERHNLKKKTHGNGDKIVVLEMKLNERAHQLASQLIKKERAYLDQEPEGIPLDRLPLDRDHSFHSMELERRQLLRESQCAAAVKELESSLNRRAHELAKEVRGWQDKDFHTANEHIGEEWLRICELFPDGRLQSLEPESPAVSDVGSAPGDVGYLAPFLAALSRYPVLLQRLIATKEHPINGPYTFIFFDPCSNPVFVDIDDRVPCTSDFMPRFIQSPNRLWYPLLLEKAYAKFVGGYEQMDICTPHETLRDLTGRPVTHLPFDRKLAEAANIGDYTSTAFWRDVSDGLSHGDVMLCMSKNEPSEMDGLHPQCSYALLSVIETVPGSNNPSDIVIKIHNAYRGYKPVYRGPLARDDQNWTDELRRVCKFEYDREDWIFLPLPTFLRSFSSMQRCHINCGDRVTAMGSWDRQTSGGNPKYTTFRNNPIYLLENKGSRAATVLAELRHKEPSFADPDGVNHYPQTGLVLMQPIVPTMPPTSLLTNSTHKFLQKGMMLDSREVCSVMQLPANSTCYVVPYTMKKGQTGAFQLSVYPGMAKVSLTPLNAGLSKEPVSTRITLNPGEEGRRVDFHLSAGGDVHILLHQEKITEARSVSRGDIVAEDEVSMAVYSDDGIKLATSGETTNAREHSLVFKASESGRYSLWLCAPSPSVSGDCPLVVSIYTTKRMTAKFIPLPLRARTPQRFPAIPPKTAPHGNPSGSRQRGRLGNNNAATAVENPQHAGTLPVIARRPSMSTTSSSVVRPMSSGQ